MTHLTMNSPEDSAPTFGEIGSGLGQVAHGTLTRYGVFHATSLVKMPETLSFREAATLTCSGLTAWNALFGIPGKFVPGNLEGMTVLVQGSGGVSVAALQVCFLKNYSFSDSTSGKVETIRGCADVWYVVRSRIRRNCNRDDEL